MTLLLDLTIRSSVLVLVGLALGAVLHRQSAAFRHAVLAMTIAAVAALVPLAAVVPTWRVSLPESVALPAWAPPAWQASLPVSADPPIATPRPSAAPGSSTLIRRPVAARQAAIVVAVAAVIWVSGVAVCAAVLLMGFFRLVRIARRAQRVPGGEWSGTASQLQAAYGLRRPVTLLETDAPDLLATFGVRHHRVLLPVHASAWSHDRIQVVLSHELAHVRRHDWLVQVSAEALRCVYWFNPLMWIACARLRRESEYACDDAVLGRGMAPRDYAVHLLELARACRRQPRPAVLPALPMARASTLERRITVMLNPAVNRTSVSRRAQVAAGVLLACLSLSVAAVRAGQNAQNPPAPVGPTAQAVWSSASFSVQDGRQGTPKATPAESSWVETPTVDPQIRVPAATLARVRTPSLAAAPPAGQVEQNGPAPLVGSIYDASGGVLPGVDLTLQDAKQTAWTATTNVAGRFEFPSVAPGTYVLEAKLAGFRTLRQEIALRTAGDWDRAITLQVGELSEKVVVSTSRIAMSAAPSPTQPTRLKVGGNVRAPRKIQNVAPLYPPSMREAGREGVVPIEAVIGTDGSVISVRVLSADVHPDFAIAAVDAVRQWKFEPTLLNGAPIEVRMTVSVEFTLSK